MAGVDGPRTLVPVAEEVPVGLHPFAERRQRFRVGDVGHRHLVLGPRLVGVKGGGQVEDGPAVLDGHHPAGGEGAPVADAVDLVEDRDGGIAGPQEVGVQRVHALVVVDCATCGHQGLTRDLAAEDPLALLVGTEASEDVDLDDLEVEQLDQRVQGLAQRKVASQSAASWRPCSASARHLASNASSLPKRW